MKTKTAKPKTVFLICLDKRQCHGTKAPWQAVKIDEEASQSIFDRQGGRCFQCGKTRSLTALGPVEAAV